MTVAVSESAGIIASSVPSGAIRCVIIRPWWCRVTRSSARQGADSATRIIAPAAGSAVISGVQAKPVAACVACGRAGRTLLVSPVSSATCVSGRSAAAISAGRVGSPRRAEVISTSSRWIAGAMRASCAARSSFCIA